MNDGVFDLSPYLLSQAQEIPEGRQYLMLKNSWDKETVLIGPILEFSVSESLLWLRFDDAQHLFMQGQDNLYLIPGEQYFSFNNIVFDSWMVRSNR